MEKTGQATAAGALKQALDAMAADCLRCGLCRSECGFLQRYGQPGEIAAAVAEDLDRSSVAYACSQCRLCSAVCPVGLDPAALFRTMRVALVDAGKIDLKPFAPILAYERRGISPRYSFYGLPLDCDTVFFPGCTLSGTRSRLVERLFDALRNSIPGLGLVLDCCARPSHDLGREDFFHCVFGEMVGYLTAQGVGRVLVACPNCYRTFRQHAVGMAVETVYERLSSQATFPAPAESARVQVGVHDPCALRFEPVVQDAVRTLLRRSGMDVLEMAHNRARTFCCGEGGSAGFVAPDLSQRWATLRKSEAKDLRLATYCAGCANRLGGPRRTAHVLDLLFDREAALSGGARVTRPPFTYVQRLLLKRRLRKRSDWAATRVRPRLL